MSISQNFPDEGPSLNLNFAGSRRLDPRITFTRSSSATFTDENGLIVNASSNVPRFDHLYTGTEIQSLGLLIEESRSNLTNYSTYNASAWSNIFPANATLTTGITAPDGTNTAVRLTCATTGSSLLRVTFPSFTPNGTDTYTTSFYVRLISGNTSTSSQLTTDLADGSPNGNYLPNLITNQWVRVSFSGVPTATAKSFIDLLSDNTNNYVLDFWGVQIENGAFATSYIPTSGSTATRSADNAVMTGTNFTNWYNTLEGSLFAAARINALGGSGYPGITYIDDGTQNNCIGFYVSDAIDDKIGAEAYVSGGAQYGFGSISAIVPFQLNRVISTYKVNDFAAAFSMGGTVGTDTAGSVPTVNRLIIGDLRGGNAKLNGTIAQILYYPKRLTNDQLQTLTR